MAAKGNFVQFTQRGQEWFPPGTAGGASGRIDDSEALRKDEHERSVLEQMAQRRREEDQYRKTLG